VILLIKTEIIFLFKVYGAFIYKAKKTAVIETTVEKIISSG